MIKLPKNVGDLSKSIVAKGFEKLPKVQLIAQSGLTGRYTLTSPLMYASLVSNLKCPFPLSL